jgi:homotetrameric cytidine deaminase
MIQGILFDMDGVLLDSEAYICEAAIAFFRERGVKTAPEDFIPFVGAGENRYLGGVAEKYGIPISDIAAAKERTYAIYGELVKGRLEPLAGVVDFIRECRCRGLKLAVATSADKTKMEINLHEIGLDHGEFDVLLNGLDVERKKPFPDIYALAAEKLGLETSDCVVVEDAPNGIEAAEAAGCSCIGITSSFPAEELSAKGADIVVSGFSDLSDFAFLTDLEWFSHERLLKKAYRQANVVREHAYTPYSGFKVGAALVTRTGEDGGSGGGGDERIYSGCNVENASYGATICAERNAVLSAIAAEGIAGDAADRRQTFSLLVVTADTQNPTPPCAQCLQVLSEFCSPDFPVYLANTKRILARVTFGELLPYPFDGSPLEKKQAR